ncbi:MAG TPA: Phenylacetic acid catabolic protein, partial [Candidatus Binatia bacterium]
ETKRKVQKVLDYWYVKALDMFGHSGSKRSERYRYWGLKRRTNAEARRQYMEEVKPIILGMGLELPDPNKGRLYM